MASLRCCRSALATNVPALTNRNPWWRRRVVAEPASEANVWWGPVNVKMKEQAFMLNRERAKTGGGEYASAFKENGATLDVSNLKMPYWLMNFEEHCEILLTSRGNERQGDADILAKCLLAARLKKLGYDTFLVGKWHLGFVEPRYTPVRRGFDTSFGYYTVQFESDGTTQLFGPAEVEVEIPITGVQHPGFAAVADTGGLIPLLLDEKDAQPLLIVAGPGTGKTWSMKQVAFLLAENLAQDHGTSQLLPLLVPVQALARMMRARDDRAAPNLIVEYIETRADERWRPLLLDGYERRALALLLDGIDEASGLRDEIEELIVETLVPMGFPALVATSRESGITRPERYVKEFVIMSLRPLTGEQQRAVIDAQLKGNEFFMHTFAFSEIRKTNDDIYGRAFSDELRKEIESFSRPNKWLRPDGSNDPERRQKTIDGTHGDGRRGPSGPVAAQRG